MNNRKTGIFALCFLFFMIIAVGAYSFLSVDYSPNREAAEQEIAPASDFTAQNADGKEFSLSDFKGKPVVVNFWATWCGPCKSELPAFENAYKKYGDKVNFMMVNMTDGQRETVTIAKDFTAENGYTYPLYFDTKMDAAMTYSVYSIPMTLFVDAEGNLVKTRKGAVSEGYLMENIEMLLK